MVWECTHIDGVYEYPLCEEGRSLVVVYVLHSWQ